MVRAVHKLFRLSASRRVNDLPSAYIDYLEKFKEPAERLHDPPPETTYLDYKQDKKTGYVYRVPDQPIPVVRPPKSQIGLWGGIGVVEGFEKPKRLKPRWTRLWYPTIERHTFHCEILDTWINVEVTIRTLDLIDKNKGFDFYILNTRLQDLHSEFGRRLKHKMLLVLASNPSDFVREKYKDYIRPLEEIEWYGLKEHEAISKFKLMRIEESIAPPLKSTFAQQLLEELKSERQVSGSAQ